MRITSQQFEYDIRWTDFTVPLRSDVAFHGGDFYSSK